MAKRLTTEKFIEKAKIKHHHKYDYLLTDYVNSKDKVKIICIKHGVFLQSPGQHLYGNGCRKCKYENLGIEKSIGKEKFTERSNIIHKNKYNYDKVKYINNKTKVEIICKDHGSFYQRPDMHMNEKHGCPFCNKSNIFFNSTSIDNMKNKKCLLYLMKFLRIDNSLSFIKIGITTLSIKDRFRGYGRYYIENIYTLKDSLFNCFNYEQDIINNFNTIDIHDKDFKGKTECFSINDENKILNFLDKLKIVPLQSDL